MSEFLTVHLCERWVTCFVCGQDTDQTEPQDRLSVPVWNGEPTTSTDPSPDGYMPACPRCYTRWSLADDKALAKAPKPEGGA